MKSTPRLAVTQARFQENVLSGDPAIDGQIAGDSAEFRNTRLAIYRDAYRLRLTEVLATDYAVLNAYLGDGLFNTLASEYTAAHPSTFRNVRWFGGKLAQFLRATRRHAAHPELAEIAAFEWALGRAFDAQDHDAVRFEEVAAVRPEAWPDLRFKPHPALGWLDLRTNAVTIWKAIKNNDPPPAVGTLPAPVTWAVWRQQYAPFFRSLDADEAWALKTMLTQASFGDICVGLCEWIAEHEAAARAAGMLRGWVEAGWIGELLTAS